MSKLRVVVGLFTVVMLVWLFALGNEKSLGPILVEKQAGSRMWPEDGLSMAIAHVEKNRDIELPDDWQSVSVSDCTHFAPVAAVEHAASVNPLGWTPQQLCAWMLTNSDMLNSKITDAQQRRSSTLDSQFPEGAFDSPYQDFSTAELELAAPNDGVASYVLATRLQYIDRGRSDELFIQSATQTQLPGPLMAAVFARSGVNLARDPKNGSVVYAEPDDVFRAAVLATTVEHMGYDFHQAGFFMEHVAKAMGPDATNAVLVESQRLYEQISLQGAARE